MLALRKDNAQKSYENLLDAIKETKSNNEEQNIDRYNFNLNDFDEEGKIKK